MTTKTKAPKPKNESGQCTCNTQVAYRVTAEDIPEADPATFEEYDVYGPCGHPTQNFFAPGHDAKLKSLLVRLGVEGLGYEYLAGSMLIGDTPLNQAKHRGWGPAVAEAIKAGKVKAKAQAAKAKDKAKAEAERTARDAAREQARNDRIAARVLKQASQNANATYEVDPEDAPEPTHSIKIGRFTYEGRVIHDSEVATDDVVVSYFDPRKNEIRSTRVARSNITPLEA